MAEYRFLTIWHIRAPVGEVFDAILDSHGWPQWWDGLERVEEVLPGDADGIGSVRRYTWKSATAYRLRFDARTTRIVRGVEIAATVEGDLAGLGQWRFSGNNDFALVHYLWQVRTGRWWMNLVAPVAQPLFKRNHHLLMEQGAKGLARRLHAPLVAVSHIDGGSLPF